MNRASGQIIVLIMTVLYLSFCLWTASKLSYNDEDMWHLGADSLKEGLMQAEYSYMAWNARIGELLIYLQGGLFRASIIPFMVMNTICLGILPHLCFRLGTGRWAGREASDALGFTFCIFSVLSIHSGIYWFSGNMNWLYPCTIASILLISIEQIFHGNFNISPLRLTWLVPCAIVAGMSNENTAITTTTLVWGAWCYAVFKQKRWVRPSVSYLLIALVLLLSAAAFYMAPAGAARTANANWELTFDCWWNKSILSPGTWIFHHICQLRPILSLCVLLSIAFLAKKMEIFRFQRLKLLIVIYFMLWSVLTLAPCWGQPRSYVPLDITFSCILCGLIMRLSQFRVKRNWLTIAIVAHIMLALTMIIPETCYIYIQKNMYNALVAQAKKAAHEGKNELVLSKNSLQRRHIIHAMTWCPRFIFLHTQKISTPTISNCSPIMYENRDSLKPKGFHPCQPEYIQDFRNTILAKTCGLDAIYVIDRTEK